MKTKTLTSIFLISLVMAVPSFSQTDLTKEAIRFALSTFNPAISQQEYQHQVQGILNRVLHDHYDRTFSEVLNNDQLNHFEQQKEIMASISKTSDVTFIVLMDGSTYWTDSVRGQRFRFSDDERTILSGLISGEQVRIPFFELSKNVLSVEFSYSNPNLATVTRNDGNRFIVEDANIQYFQGRASNTYLRYIYNDPVTGSEQSNLIWGSNDQRLESNFIRLIVFGLQRPKMNPNTQEHFPPDYTFDPYDGSVLVPVPYQAPWRP